MNGPEDTAYNQNISTGLGFASTQRVSPAVYSNNFYMIAICNKCSHVQLFRPDMVKGAEALWNRKFDRGIRAA